MMASTSGQNDTSADGTVSSRARHKSAEDKPRPFIDRPSSYLANLEAAYKAHGPNWLEAAYKPVHVPWEPTWWFFYGKQAEPRFVKSVLGLGSGEEIILRPAYVRGYAIFQVGSSEVLVSVPADTNVAGQAYFIKREEDEKRLENLDPNLYRKGSCLVCFPEWKVGDKGVPAPSAYFLAYARDDAKLKAQISDSAGAAR
ncbi:uncharacterized protein B0I36DRAFT_338650 [Microdochium trichocladiopsis]|uniref:Gamma-glutamylcyclotransferase AIG2-like domain-containing protein n=1 Tax=Microdochium trichocladiopsis TaxID=1682393 RepID=A0A9P9BG74_9PEZI|nr:uncharacterized protein B0I36DRAFT_338650 [Microdochium trichocladiopsis]KAH7014384.1 hypothetical protein B0I36DRAFT_338650 [Microdochium trichocladiopsis]